MPVSKGIKETIMADMLYRSGNEFTSKQAHALMGRDAIQISTGTCLSRMVKAGVLTKREGTEDGHHMVYYKSPENYLDGLSLQPKTTIDRTRELAVFNSYEEFTSADLLGMLSDKSKGAINSALTTMQSYGEIRIVRKDHVGKGVHVNVYVRVPNNRNWICKPWVSEPTSDEHRPVMC